MEGARRQAGEFRGGDAPFPTQSQGVTDPRVLRGDDLPARLRELPTPPEPLYLWGRLPPGPLVGIVGTRNPSPEAERFTSALARELASAGVAVASGGAAGIDVAAHRGAFEATGVTLVVAPSGLDRAYPAQHEGFFREIVARGGGYLTPSEPEAPPSIPAFHRRNRVLAALVDALVLVEAAEPSGALRTTHAARRFGRPVFVVAHAPWNARGTAWARELSEGARLLTSADDVLAALGAAPRGRGAEKRAQPGLPFDGVRPTARFGGGGRSRAREAPVATRAPHAELPNHLEPQEKMLLDALGARRLGAAELCAETQLPASEAQRFLLTLTLSGVLVCDDSGRYSRAVP